MAKDVKVGDRVEIILAGRIAFGTVQPGEIYETMPGPSAKGRRLFCVRVKLDGRETISRLNVYPLLTDCPEEEEF